MVFTYTSLDLLQIKDNAPSSLIDCLPRPTWDLLKELEINNIKSTRRGCRSGTHVKLYSALVSKLIGSTNTASNVFKHVTPPNSTDQIPKPDSDTGVKHVNLPNLVHSGVTHVSLLNSAGQIPVPVNTPSNCVKSETSSRPTSGLATLTSSERPLKSTLSSEETKALKELRNDQNLVISKADKGNTTVVMDKTGYDKRLLTMLEDNTTYQQLQKDTTPNTEKTVNKFVSQLVADNKITKIQSYRLKSSNGRAPVLYGLPKLHKENTPQRPTVSFTGSPTYNLSKDLA